MTGPGAGGGEPAFAGEVDSLATSAMAMAAMMGRARFLTTYRHGHFSNKKSLRGARVVRGCDLSLYFVAVQPEECR
jgi:hypothetical protein